MALWPSIIRIVDTVEGSVGALLNCAVIYLIWRRKYTSNLLAYRICTTIIAVQGLLISGVVITLSNTVHLFHYDNILIIVYGFLATLNETVGRLLIYFSLFSTFCVFQFIPGACLLQYFTLCKPHYTTAQRFLFSYALCIAMLLWDTPYFLSFYPSQTFDKLVRQVHQPVSCDPFVTLGAVLMPTKEHPKAMLNFALECVIPTYSISYGTFALCMMKCRGILSSFDVKLSKKTLQMHRTFLIMLALQNLLPLIILSIPIGIFIVAVVSGYPMGLLTLVVSFSYWTLPIIQGTVALIVVLRNNKHNVEDVRSKNSFSLTRP